MATMTHGHNVSEDNSKTEQPGYNLPPIKTCAKGVPCAYPKDKKHKCGMCYADKHVYRRFPQSRDAYDNNLKLLKENGFEPFIADICEYVQNKAPGLFRWHSSGDVFSVAYMRAIITIARKCPRTTFLLMTKQYDNVHGGIMMDGKPDNLTVYMSCWDDYSPSAEIMARTDIYRFNYFQDKAGLIKNPDGLYECPGSCAKCKVCFYGTANVVFHEH